MHRAREGCRAHGRAALAHRPCRRGVHEAERGAKRLCADFLVLTILSPVFDDFEEPELHGGRDHTKRA